MVQIYFDLMTSMVLCLELPKLASRPGNFFIFMVMVRWTKIMWKSMAHNFVVVLHPLCEEP